MYTKDEVILGISCFNTSHGMEVLLDFSNQIKVNDLKRTINFENVTCLQVFGDLIYVSNLKGQHLVLDYQLNGESTNGAELYYPINDSLLGFQYLDDERKVKNAIITENREIIDLIGIDKKGNQVLTHNFILFFQSSKNSLGAYCISDLSMKWLSSINDVSTKGIIKLISVLREKLLVYCHGRKILVLDSNSGEINNVLNGPDQVIGDSNIDEELRPYPFFKTDYLLNEDKTCIYGLAMDLFYEIKVENEEVISVAYSLKKEYDRLGINHEYISKNNVLHGKHFYFMLEDQLRFAVLDVENKEIVYLSDKIDVSDTSSSFTKLKEIQVTDSKVYVLASDNNLHIYDLEVNND